MTNETQQALSPSPVKPVLALEPLSPQQVNVMWPQMQAAIKASLPPTEVTDEAGAMNGVLVAVMKGELQVWLATKRDGDSSVRVFGGVVTQITGPSVSGIKSLWIYSLFIHELPPTQLVGKMLDTLKDFARASGCKGIFAFTNNEAIRKLVDHLHGNTDYRLVSLEV